MTPQELLIFNATRRYAEKVTREWKLDKEGERMVQAAYISGVLSTAQALAMKDGVSVSKFAEAARNAGEALLGIKSTPANEE